jgi:hypothetical protein
MPEEIVRSDHLSVGRCMHAHLRGHLVHAWELWSKLPTSQEASIAGPLRLSETYSNVCFHAHVCAEDVPRRE